MAEMETQVQPATAAPTDAATADKQDKHRFNRDAFGKDISYGVQQTLACFATDFIDPFVGDKIQQAMEPGKGSALKHAWGGEIAGDTAALFAFLGVQRFAPQITQKISKATRPLLEKAYERSGKSHLKHLHIDPSDPSYQQKLNEWKDVQSDNMGKTSVIAASSVAFNVGTQKLMGNDRKVFTILVAKIAGAVITMAAMMGLRAGLPRTTTTMDDELNDRVFSPVIRKTQKLFGATVDDKPRHGEKHAARYRKDSADIKLAGSHLDRLNESRDTLVADTLLR